MVNYFLRYLIFTNPALNWSKALLAILQKQVFDKDLHLELQELLLKLVLKNLNGRIFQKTLEKPNFRPFMPRYEYSLKLDCISFCKLTIFSHMAKSR